MPSSVDRGQHRLDVNREGQHCGCLMLFEATRRARLKLHRFGHIHEGYGVQEVTWGKSGEAKPEEGRCDGERDVCECSDHGSWGDGE